MKSLGRAATVAALALYAVGASRLRKNNTRPVTNGSSISGVALHGARRRLPTFQTWYDSYSSGRGIWKWQQALDAYQASFGRFAGYPVSVLEIGVQSGGSIDMYHSVLGDQCHYYGMDINPRTAQFGDASTTISILDQGDTAQWAHFFQNVAPQVDIVIDDGGHQAHQMLTTLKQALPHIRPGGVHLIEDIHAENTDYLTSLFNPAADFLASMPGAIASISIYPFVMTVQLQGGSYVVPAPLPPIATLTSIGDLLTAIPQYPGQVLHLANPTWPSMFGADGLKNIFATFYDLHKGVSSADPPGCFGEDANQVQCTMRIANSVTQSQITSVDIYSTLVQVRTAAQSPQIQAVRRGTVWIPYSG